MKRDNIDYFVDCEFDETRVPTIAPELIEIAYDEGKVALDKQNERFNKIWNNTNTIIGWLLGAVIALAGITVSQLAASQRNPFILWMSLYGLVATLAPMLVLMLKAIYKRRFYSSGDTPAHILREEMIEHLNHPGAINEKVRYFKGWYLAELQFKYLRNKEELNRSIRYYRIAIQLIVLGIAGAFILTCALLAVL